MSLKIPPPSSSLKPTYFSTWRPRQRNTCICCHRLESRNFSQTAYLRVKREKPDPAMESRFIAWKEGPGGVFRRPLPGSTNYLNAYNKQGKLIRQALQNQQDEELDQ